MINESRARQGNLMMRALKGEVKRQDLEDVQDILYDIREGKKSRQDFVDRLKAGGVKEEKLENDDQVDQQIEKFSSVQTLKHVVNSLRKGKGKLTNEAANVAEQYLASMIKGFAVADTADIRVVDMSRVVEMVYPTETPFANMIDIEGSSAASDLSVKYFEYQDNTAKKKFFDPDKGPNTGSRKLAYKTNTIGFYGTGDSTGRIAEEISRNQGFGSPIDRAITASIQDIRNHEDVAFLSNTEVPAGPIFENKGLIEHFVTNNTNIGGNFTAANLNSTYAKVVNKFGPQDLALLVRTQTQIEKIDDLRKVRFPGIYGTVNWPSATLTSNLLKERNIPVGTWFKMANGQEIPVIMLPTLPTTKAMFFNPANVTVRHLALPSFGTGAGPFMLVSMIDNSLTKIMQIFKSGTIEVRGERKMILCTGVTD